MDCSSIFHPADVLPPAPGDWTGRETIVVLVVVVVCGDLRGHESQPEKGGKDGEVGRGWRWLLLILPHPPLHPPPCPAQVSTAQLSSWPPRAASSCWAAPPSPTRSWSRSHRRTPTRRCLWDWCTGCCRTTSSWPGAEWSPSPSPERGLRDHKTQEERKEVRKRSGAHSDVKIRLGTRYMSEQRENHL